MTIRDRVLAALRRESTGRVPVVSICTGVSAGLMDLCGASLPEANHDAGQLSRLASAAFEYCGLESIKLPFDMTVETEALGGLIDFGSKTVLPQVKAHPYKDIAAFAFDPDSFQKAGRIPVVLDAIRITKQRLGNRCPVVVASIVGPFTLAGKLFGLSELFLLSADEPELLHEALAKVTDLCIFYANLLAGAGADVILAGEATCSGDLISPAMYEEFAAPCQKKLCAAVHAPLVLHICGQIIHHMPAIVKTGAAGISFDAKTDVGEMCRLYRDRISLIGAVDVIQTLSHGTPGQVKEACQNCLDAGVHILSAGCAWPLDTPIENIRAMTSFAHI